MDQKRAQIPAARSLLKLIDSDRKRAAEIMAGLEPEQQVAAICSAPFALRSRILDLVPSPEEVVPLIPEAELCFLCKHVGIEDSGWLLALATDHQIITCFDLDAWHGLSPNVERLDSWMASLAEAGDATMLRAAQALDPELLALYLRAHVHVVLKPAGDEGWQPMEGAQTLEGQFYFAARGPKDDLAPITKLMHALFQKDYWLYFRMMQSVEEELQMEIEEWALRWRTGRLEDLGFPSWDSSMRIYGHLRNERFADVAEDLAPLDLADWALPVWVPELPAMTNSQHSILMTAAELEPDERRAFFYSFISLANKVAVADRLGLGEADTLPDTIEKAALVSSRGLEHIAVKAGLTLIETLRRVSLERLFRVGVNLQPEGIRPSPAELDAEDEEQAEEQGENEGGGAGTAEASSPSTDTRH